MRRHVLPVMRGREGLEGLVEGLVERTEKLMGDENSESRELRIQSYYKFNIVLYSCGWGLTLPFLGSTYVF